MLRSLVTPVHRLSSSCASMYFFQQLFIRLAMSLSVFVDTLSIYLQGQICGRTFDFLARLTSSLFCAFTVPPLRVSSQFLLPHWPHLSHHCDLFHCRSCTFYTDSYKFLAVVIVAVISCEWEWLFFQNATQVQLHGGKNPVVLYQEMKLQFELHVRIEPAAASMQQFNWSGPPSRTFLI